MAPHLGRSGRCQTAYRVKLREKDEKLCGVLKNHGKSVIFNNMFAIMLQNCNKSEVVLPNLSSNQDIRGKLVYIVSLSPGNAHLHSKQLEVLKKAQIPGVKAMVLTGNTGSGKTVLAAEVTKIWMAEHMENSPEVSYC